MAGEGRLIEMAVVGAAHGLKGECRVKSFAADPAGLGGYGPLVARDGRRFEIAAVRPAGSARDGMLVVRFKGVADRTAAEALNGLSLFLPRESLPDTGDEDEFYHSDLIGLAVRDGEGVVIGRVTAVEDFGGGDLLEIEREGRGRVLIPFTRAAVPALDVAGGFVTVEPVAAGLVEGEPDEGEERDEGR